MRYQPIHEAPPQWGPIDEAPPHRPTSDGAAPDRPTIDEAPPDRPTSDDSSRRCWYLDAVLSAGVSSWLPQPRAISEQKLSYVRVTRVRMFFCILHKRE